MIQKIIDRPVLATVVSVILVFLGIISIVRLARTQFPDIAPPTVSVEGTYPGGNSESVTRSVIVPLEEAINGVEGMDYIQSTAGSDGYFTVRIVFKLGTDPDQAAVNVQNRVAQVNSQIPQEVLQAGITTTKQQNSNIMMFNIVSHDIEKYDELFLQNYTKINLIPAIKRIQGVGNVQLFGAKDYSMRIWLDPQKLAVNKLEPSDIQTAIANSSFETSPGKFGEDSDAPMQYIIKYQGKLNTPEQFEKIVIKSNSEGSLLRLRDVARIELGSASYGIEGKQNGMPAVTVGVLQTSGSNASQIETEVRNLLTKQSKTFPKGIDYTIIQSAKERLDAAISQVIKTLIEAFILVVIVVFIFLQDLRSTLIPAIAVPVSIVGTFFFLYFIGFSINVLTLFALVLAIGIVVDDAIVVVEAVHSKLEGGSKDQIEATKSAMSEITGVIISITLVMCAVFLPIGFMEGPAGIFYKQFAYTLVFAILISAVNALTLSPALCALLLRPHEKEYTPFKKSTFKDRFFYAFNIGFKSFTDKYLHIVNFSIKRKWFTMTMLTIISGIAFWMMNTAPKDFVPAEDDRFVTYSLALPAGTNTQHTTTVIDRLDSAFQQMPEVETVTSISGFNLLSNNSGPSYAMGFMRLKDKKDRGEIQDMDKIIEQMNIRTQDIKSGELSLFRSPPVEGFGNMGGAELVVQDRTGGSIERFTQVTEELIRKLNEDPATLMAFTTFRNDFPQFEVEVDEDKTYQLGTTPREVLNTLQLYYAGGQANDFIRFGKFYRVNIQAEGQYRMDEQSLSQVYVKNQTGNMIPINSLVKLTKVYGPEAMNRYNLFTSINVNILSAPGYSNGQLMAAAEKIIQENLPEGYGYEWSGLSREEKKSGEQMFFIFALCILFTYFLLSAQYESYVLPLAVIFSIPTGLLGVFLAIGLAGITNNIYVQIGLIMLIGLLAKNAILIVEFAVQARKKGIPIVASALEGARQRFRPILMTSLAFIIGLVPLTLATGSSAVGNKSISIGAIGGMLSGVMLGVIFIPVLFIVFQTLHEKITGRNNEKEILEN
ncbi:MAG: efflux RND transporter permease subunit [Dysgonomonas sp.]